MTKRPRAWARPWAAGLGLLLWAPSAPTQSPAEAVPQASAAPAPAAGVPVIYRGRELGRVYRPIGPLSAEERAVLAAGRVDQLVRDASVDPAALKLVHQETSSEIVLGERVLATLTDEDAAAAGLPRRQAAEAYLAAIRESIVATRAELSTRGLLAGLGWALLATALYGLACALAVRIARRLERLMEESLARARQRTRGLLSWAQLGVLATSLLQLLRAALLLAATLVWLQAVLAALPWTRPHARLVLRYVLDPLGYLWAGFVAFLPNVFFLLVIAAVTWASLKLVRLAFVEIERGLLVVPGFPDEWAQPTYKLVRVFLIALAVVVAWPYIPGSQSPAFQSVSLFLGLLVSLSSSSAISNVIAGTMLTYTRGFRLGDRVRIAEAVGDVVEKTLFVTRVRTVKNEVVSIPNSLVIGSPIVNYSRIAAAEGLILHTTVTIGYDAPWRQVHELLVAAALRTDGVLPEPAPFVLQTALDDFYVRYELNAYTRQAERMPALYSALHANIQDRFNEAGVEIMSPHYSSLRDGNAIAIPGSYRPAGYQSPAFRVGKEQK